MAQTSEVKSGMVAIGATISGSRDMASNDDRIRKLHAARNQLVSIDTVHADVLATVDGFDPRGAFETAMKDEKDLLLSERALLQAAIETDLTALGETF